MTLYDEIRNEEKRIAGLQKEIQHLQENGFNVERFKIAIEFG